MTHLEGLRALEDATDCAGAAREQHELAVVSVATINAVLDHLAEAARRRADEPGFLGHIVKTEHSMRLIPPGEDLAFLPTELRGEVIPVYDGPQTVTHTDSAYPQRDGWIWTPKKPTPAMLERAAFNLCATYGVEFVQPLGQFVEDAYAELLAAAPKPDSAP